MNWGRLLILNEMKKIKNFMMLGLVFALIVPMGFLLTGCSWSDDGGYIGTAPRLATPGAATLAANIISWNEIEGAPSHMAYAIYINGVRNQYTSETSVALNRRTIVSNQSVNTIQIRAVASWPGGSNQNFTNSHLGPITTFEIGDGERLAPISNLRLVSPNPAAGVRRILWDVHPGTGHINVYRNGILWRENISFTQGETVSISRYDFTGFPSNHNNFIQLRAVPQATNGSFNSLLSEGINIMW